MRPFISSCALLMLTALARAKAPAPHGATSAPAVLTADIPATAAWTGTDFVVESGKCYRITATGTWTGSDGQATGPAGICPEDLYNPLGVQHDMPHNQRAQYYLGQHPRDALICWIGGAKFNVLVGKDITFVAPNPGRLAFKINDEKTRDSTRSGQLHLTFTEATPQWVDKDGYTTIGARIDSTDYLHLTSQGPFWEWGGKVARPGDQGGRFPTIINGIFVWPRWTSRSIAATESIPALWNKDPDKIRLVSFQSGDGSVEVKSSGPDEVVLAFTKSHGFGAEAIWATLNFKGQSSPSPEQPPAPSAVAAAAPPVDPMAIERPQYRNRAKPLVKTLASVSAMMVTTIGNNEIDGQVGDIISTVSEGAKDPPASLMGHGTADVGKQMDTAFEEALRAVRVRYPRWSGGNIEVSFGDKYTPKDGGSAGTAFAVLMLSNLEGFTIDPKFAITGDVTVDWKVRPVGGIILKLRGAARDKCLYAAIPVENETPFADMRLLEGDASLWNIQTFSIAKVQDAVALLRTDRSANVTQAMELFATLQPDLTAHELLTLHEPKTNEMLEQILKLAPNCLSAKYLLELINHTAPTTLSPTATLYAMGSVYAPYGVLLAGKPPVVNRETLPMFMIMTTRKRVAMLRPIIDPKFAPLLARLLGFCEAMNEFATGSLDKASLVQRAGAYDAAWKTLDDDPQFMATLLRDGY